MMEEKNMFISEEFEERTLDNGSDETTYFSEIGEADLESSLKEDLTIGDGFEEGVGVMDKLQKWVRTAALPAAIIAAGSFANTSEAASNWRQLENSRRQECRRTTSTQQNSAKGFKECLIRLRRRDNLKAKREYFPNSRCNKNSPKRNSRLTSIYGLPFRCVTPIMRNGSNTISLDKGFWTPEGFSLQCQVVGFGKKIAANGEGNLVSKMEGANEYVSAVCSAVRNDVSAEQAAKGGVISRQREAYRSGLSLANYKIAKLKKEISELKIKLAQGSSDSNEKLDLLSKLRSAQATIDSLKTENSSLKLEVTQLQQEVNSLKSKLEAERQKSNAWRSIADTWKHRAQAKNSDTNNSQSDSSVSIPDPVQKKIAKEFMTLDVMGGGGPRFKPDGKMEGFGGANLSLRFNLPSDILSVYTGFNIQGGSTLGTELGFDGGITLHTPRDMNFYAALTAALGVSVTNLDKQAYAGFEFLLKGEVGVRADFLRFLAFIQYLERGYDRSLMFGVGAGVSFK